MANNDGMRKFENILIVPKMTDLEAFEHRFGSTMGHLDETGIDTAALEDKHREHEKNLDRIMACFQSQGITPGVIQTQSLSSRDILGRDWDLIVPVGGDGTFMDVARYILDDTLIFGIKSSAHSIGGHYNTSFSTAKEHIDRLFEGYFNVDLRTRVEGLVQGIPRNITETATNEIFVGDRYSPGYAHLTVFINGETYETGSSGIVISTYHGRTGWFDKVPIAEKSAERIAKLRALTKGTELADVKIICSAANFQTGEEQVVRYKLRESRHTGGNKGFDYGVLKEGDEMRVVSGVFMDGLVSFDGSKPGSPRPRSYPISHGTEVVVRVSDKPLHVVNFD